MANSTLNRLFLTYKPGDELSWTTFDRDVEDALARVGLVRDQIDQANDAMERGETPNPASAIFCNPILMVFEKLEFVVRYFYGEFEIKTSKQELREELAGIWYELIKGWYFGESLYVGYGSDFEAIDRVKFEQDGKDFELDGIPGKFRLFTKSGEKQFQSILSGLSGIEFTPEQKKRIVKVGQHGYWNWLYWWHLWAKWLKGMERFEHSVRDLSKNVILTPRTEAEVQSINEQFNNLECYIKREGMNVFGIDSTPAMNKTKFEEIIFMPRETPMAILEGIQRAFELNAAHMGFAGKLAEQKAERINAGENYPHHKVVSNVVTYLIGTLNYAFDRMRIAFGEDVIPRDLEIVRTNQAFAQGLPEFQPGGNFNQYQNPINEG